MAYDDYYHAGNLEVPAFVRKRLAQIVDGFSGYRQTNRLLDVGFGAGELLKAAIAAGWAAEGVEVSLPAIEHARSARLNVFHGELEEAAFLTGSFDIVVAVELIEHLADPAALVREVARILRPGGLFWATSPHARGLSARVLGAGWSVVAPPEHLQLFSLQGAKRLFRAAGFDRVTIRAEGVNPLELLHALRSLGRASSPRAEFDRVGSGYKLNRFMSERSLLRLFKSGVNAALRLSRLGDSLKIRAVRP